MINLLPPTEKEILIQEERFRLSLILGVIILTFLISLTLILVSVKIYISAETKTQKIILELEQHRLKTTEIQDLENKVNLINQNLLNLNSFYLKQISFTQLLEKIYQILPTEIYLTQLSLTKIDQKKEKSIVEASLSGFSPSREVLFRFKKNLEKEPDFQEIYFPPSNWIKPTDIDFNLTFKISL